MFVKETSAGWQPPGHIPWETVKHSGADTCWVPEGAIFSPDYFSIALSQSRRSFRDVQTHLKFCMPSPYTSSLGECMCTDSPVLRSSTGEPMNVELLEMMRELKSIKSFFQNSQDVCEPDNLSLPSLVVSNSHFTFPIPLESSSSISHSSLNSLAIRRGPPTLLLPKSRFVQEVSYPGIPTAFLRSHSRYCPNFERCDVQEKPCLEFEEMINNLHLQCSTMSLQTSPIDTSWNSRSTSDCIDRLTETDNDDWSFADEFLNDHKQISLSRLTTGSRTSRYHRHAPSFSHSALRGHRSRLQTIHMPGRKTREQGTKELIDASSTTTNSRSDVCHTECLPLRSAMKKTVLPARLTPSKSVRFCLTQQELQKELASMEPIEENIPKEELVAMPISPAKQEYKKVFKRLPSTAVLSRDDSKRSASRATMPSSRLQGGARSATTGSTLCQSILTKAMSNSENTKSIPTEARSRISIQSLGRHSLSRIIKGPIFPARDRRATLSSMTVITNDENSARRESVAYASIRKKSRMPVPLRNILTRFK